MMKGKKLWCPCVGLELTSKKKTEKEEDEDEVKQGVVAAVGVLVAVTTEASLEVEDGAVARGVAALGMLEAAALQRGEERAQNSGASKRLSGCRCRCLRRGRTGIAV
jgi:hypothetical protein